MGKPAKTPFARYVRMLQPGEPTLLCRQAFVHYRRSLCPFSSEVKE
jgi:hypothetical protein